jgi:predicted aspartyl protease
MYFHDYDASYEPAMPIVEFSISVLRGQEGIKLSALIDSGADATAVPIRYLDQIGALPVETRWLRSATGERHRVQLYEIYLQIGNYGQYVFVVGDTFSDEAIIGCDILNHYVVTLDGPASVVEIVR